MYRHFALAGRAQPVNPQTVFFAVDVLHESLLHSFNLSRRQQTLEDTVLYMFTKVFQLFTYAVPPPVRNDVIANQYETAIQ
jgi:hypothetical protein